MESAPISTIQDQPRIPLDAPTLDTRRSTLDAPWLIAADIARATNQQKKQVHRIARREQWPTRQNRNRLEYQPPPEVAEIVLQTPLSTLDPRPSTPRVRFADLHHSDSARELVLWREESVKLYQLNTHLGTETALQLVCNSMQTKYPLFNISPSSLRRWTERYAVHHLDGLVEQKRGVVGRKAFARDLDQSDILRLTAHAVEYGSAPKGKASGRTNIARAYRDLISDPSVQGPARQWLHGEAYSKSYVPPSVRAAVQESVSPLATTLIQIGPKAAKLDGPYTDCTYDNLPAGRAWTADDMTANVYVWCEWPNEAGYLLIRPQILAIMDIGSMAWLNIRAVMRAKGQYTKDDVWGMIGDKMDAFGLHIDASGKVDEIAVLEGGTWQSNVVIGTKTGTDDESRFGGLRALGVKVMHTRTPRGKIIEGAFDVLQHAADNCPGYCGRDERKDCPEAVKQALANCRSGKSHPRNHFLHFNDYVKHLTGVMNSLNHERNDGKILRGQTPADKWATDTAPTGSAGIPAGESVSPFEVGSSKLEVRSSVFKQFPDSSKWLYRAAYRVTGVTRNGVRITVGSGKYQTAYTYSHPALENHRGRRVLVWWNDYDPDTDAVIYTVKSGRPDQLICVAPRVTSLDRFGASAEEMEREGARKKFAHNLAVTQSKSLAPYLQRPGNPGLINTRLQPGVAAAPDSETVSTVSPGRAMAAAAAAREQKVAQTAKIHRAIRQVEITPEDLQAATEVGRFDVGSSELEVRSSAPEPEMSAAEINDLLSDP